MAASGSPKSEIRFAVVMYGGVSLAIYMNGIAQELLRMVRATATRSTEDNRPLVPYRELDSVEAVYRKIAYRLAGEENGQECLECDAPLERKFVIDVISGTSAGGINGIFLAKALATGLGIDELKNLWITEGDASLLINDRNSLRNTVLKLQKDPQSLFNSQRMYQKLLEAFEKMERPGANAGAYVDELDLFVTSTDILGLTLPVKLSDSTVYERRHRNVFRFSCSSAGGAAWNDFVEENNPMLAFAARSTSSFPFAFEPVMLSDIDAVLAGKNYPKEFLSGGNRWKRFFKNYPETPPPGTVPYQSRPFGDGGYLDNKPFTYAVETISARHSDYPVQRKLLYIEPVPDHPESESEREGRPNALENSLDALLKLPRYETIRGDLEKILERNRYAERLEGIISNLERDKNESGWIPAYNEVYEVWEKRKAQGIEEPEPLWAKPLLNDREWGMLDLADMTLRKGPGYVAYQHLEIEAVTDDFGRLLGRVAGFDENSDTTLVFRNLAKAWRKKNFVRYREAEDGFEPDKSPAVSIEDAPKTLNAFLHGFDLTFPLRRLRFVRRQIDRLYLMGDEALACELSMRPELPELPASSDRSWAPSFREELLAIRKTVMQMQSRLIGAGRELRSRLRNEQVAAGSKPVHEMVGQLREALSSNREILEGCRRQDSNGSCSGEPETAFQQVIDYFLDRNHESPKAASAMGAYCPAVEEPGLDARALGFLERNDEVHQLLCDIAEAIEARLKTAIEESDAACRTILCMDEKHEGDSFGPASARSIIRNSYKNYSDYDMVLFPMLYGTGADEESRVDVSRISPEDATFLVDERECRLHKLAGTALGNFGAFMEERWRRNDIMWGQLDGAERIIAALLPDREEAAAYIGEAQTAIVLDTVQSMGREESKDLLVEAFMRPKSGKPEPEALCRFIRTLQRYAGSNVRSRHDNSQAFRDLDERELRDHYLRTFAVNHAIGPESALKNAARATTVTGKILSGIADQYGISGKKYLSVMTRAGTFFLWLIEAAVPRSMSSLVFKHWIKLLYLFEVLLVVGGYLFLNESVQRFAFTAAALTGSVHITMLWLRDIMLSRKRVSMALKSIVVALVLALLVSGLAALLAVTGVSGDLWSIFERLHGWFM